MISILLSMGNNTPLFEFFYEVFPVFRYPAKFMFPAGFSLIVLAASGYDILMSFLRSRNAFPVGVSVFLFISLTADLYLAHRHLNPTCAYSFYNYRDPRLAPIFSDPGLFRVFVDSDKFAGQRNQSIRDTHIVWQRAAMPNTGILHGISHAGGEVGLEIDYQYIMTEMLSKPWPEKLLFLRLANVKYIISTDALDQMPELRGHFEKINSLVYRLKNTLPRAWLVGQLSPATGDIIQILSTAEINPEVTALAPANRISRPINEFHGPVDRIEYRQSAKIQLDVTVNQPSVLVLSQTYYPGWKVFVDGHEQEIMRLNFLFQGTALEKGAHRIEFTFRPYGFNIFTIVSIISLIFFVIGWIGCFKISNRRQHF
jgi:hypothetical protein